LRAALANDNIELDELKEKVEAVKTASMKIGEAVYKDQQAAQSEGQQQAQDAEFKDEKKEDQK